MERRLFLQNATALAGAFSLPASGFIPAEARTRTSTQAERDIWRERMVFLARPVLENLAAGTLRAHMPVEHHPLSQDRADFTYLEAFGRLTSGMAPWLALSLPEGPERQQQQAFLALFSLACGMGFDPASPDFFNTQKGKQPLVDMAFFCLGLLRTDLALFRQLPSDTQMHIESAARSAAGIEHGYPNNWILFTAMVDWFLFRIGAGTRLDRVVSAIHTMETWYKGDGWYGDGPSFHLDYYNSFVIHPFMRQILQDPALRDPGLLAIRDRFLPRARRLAFQLERMIDPAGNFPPLGRSIAYRYGAFHALADVALVGQIPEGLSRGGIRRALGLAIEATHRNPKNFDARHWLRIGVQGSQPGLGEVYISTGSLYLCATAFLPLGLPPTDPFWTEPGESTQEKLARGLDLPADKALKEEKG